jgi:hypothetical protein
MDDLGDPFEEASKEQDAKENGIIVTPEQKQIEEIASEKPAPKETFKNADEALESVSMRLAER